MQSLTLARRPPYASLRVILLPPLSPNYTPREHLRGRSKIPLVRLPKIVIPRVLQVGSLPQRCSGLQWLQPLWHPVLSSIHEAAVPSGSEGTVKPKDYKILGSERSSVLSMEWSRLIELSTPSTTSTQAMDIVPSTLLVLQEFHFSPSPCCSQDAWFSSNILSVPRTSRSLNFHSVQTVSHHVFSGGPLLQGDFEG